MKTTEFANLLRKIIREEVRTIVKEEIKALKPMLAEAKVAPKKSAPPARTMPLPETLKQVKGPLANILQETYLAMQNEPPVDDPEAAWPDMASTFKAEQAPAMGLMSSMLNDEQPVIGRQAAMAGDPTAPFMKDYSQLLKKADNIVQGNRF